MTENKFRLIENKAGVNPPKSMGFLIIFYFFICFYEQFINLWIGSSVLKYYIIFLIIVIALKYYKFMSVSLSAFLLVLWLLMKNASILWNGYGYGMEIVEAHFISQIGMVFLLVVITSVNFNSRFVEKVVNWSYLASFSLSFLALFFSEEGHNRDRLTLTLFDASFDPNNLSAFYLVSASIALYNIFFTNKNKLLNTVAFGVSVSAQFISGSRGGLVSLLLIILINFMLGRNKGSANAIKKFVIFFFAIVVLTYFVSVFVPSMSIERLFTFDDYSGGSGRIKIWSQAISHIVEHPIIGNGWGAHDISIHNTYLGIILDVGIIGFILFSGIIVEPIYISMKRKNILAINILVAGLAPSFFLESINKRFFWNAIILATLIIKSRDTICESQNNETN